MARLFGSSGVLNRERQAILLFIAVVLVWGGNWTALKLSLEYITPLWLTTIRLVIGSLSMFGVLLLMGQRIRVPGRRDVPVLVSVGLLQMAAFLSLCNLGLMDVPPGRSSVLAFTSPLWVVPGAVWFLGERLTRQKALGLVLGFCGLLLMFDPETFPWSKPGAVSGNSLLLLAALTWALGILHVRSHRWQATPLELTPWQMLIAVVPTAILSVTFEGWPKIPPAPALVPLLIYVGPLALGFGFWAAVTVMRDLPAITTSIGFLGVPASGLIFAALILGERVPFTDLAGFALIAAGVGMVSLADRSRARAG